MIHVQRYIGCCLRYCSWYSMIDRFARRGWLSVFWGGMVSWCVVVYPAFYMPSWFHRQVKKRWWRSFGLHVVLPLLAPYSLDSVWCLVSANSLVRPFYQPPKVSFLSCLVLSGACHSRPARGESVLSISHLALIAVASLSSEASEGSHLSCLPTSFWPFPSLWKAWFVGSSASSTSGSYCSVHLVDFQPCITSSALESASSHR